MAVSPIGPISNATSFIQLALSPRLLTPAEAFNAVLETSLSGPPASPAALAGAVRPGEFASALEQALFRNLVDTVERFDLSTLTPGLQPLFAGELGLTSPLAPGALLPLLEGASPAERAVLSASLTALFNTIQLLGAEPDQEPRLGGLLDTLA
jgi:hypothetical protein